MQLNVTHEGLRRILVGDGITIKVNGVQDVTLIHPYDIGLLLERSSLKANQDSNWFWPFGLPSCAPLLSVRVTGPASVVAVRAHNSEAHVKTLFHAADNIELLSEKCYNNGHFKQVSLWAFKSLGSKLVLVQKALRNFLGNNILLGGFSRLLKAKITASNLVKFRLEVERDVTENDEKWKWVAAWKTKPVVERIWFEIVARAEGGKGWKPMVARKLTRPIMALESSPWSNLMSNISFTQIPSIILPPEALTLDAHW